MERFSRDSAHLKHSNSCPRSSNSKTLEFPSTFIKLCYACEELESNGKCNSFGAGGWGGGGGGGEMRISLTREKYWYEIRDVLVPILNAL